MILLQKFDEHHKELKGWTTIFKNQDELVEFFVEHKGHLLGSAVQGGYSLYIEEVKEHKTKPKIESRK